MLSVLQKWIWSSPMLLLVIGTGLYFTIRLAGLQFRYLGYALKLAFSRHDDEADGDISHFQSLMTALAGTIGIGSIAGVATAMMIGGVGALFWMVVCALVGMATRYAEAIVALKYRIRDQRGEMAGGPMYAIEKGLGWKWMAIWFAIAAAVAALTTGNMVQANAIADVVTAVSPFSRLWVGIATAALTGAVLFGGIRQIGRVSGFLVPAMALFYLAGGIAVVAIHWEHLPQAIDLIFRSAFSGQAAVGGFAGSTLFLALRIGVARGVFASESGLGSAPIAAAAAKSDYPGRQAMISMTGGFLAVAVVCVITGLAIATSGVIGMIGADGEPLNGVLLTLEAFRISIPFGEWVIVIGSLLFAYSTILSWAYYGERCVEYLLHERVIWAYRLFFTLAVAVGAILDLEMVWNLADIANGLMALPNMIGLLALGGVVSVETRLFLQRISLEKQGLA